MFFLLFPCERSKGLGHDVYARFIVHDIKDHLKVWAGCVYSIGYSISNWNRGDPKGSHSF